QQRIVIGIWREGSGGVLKRARMRRGETEERAAPEMRLVRAPVIVIVRLVDRLVTVDMVDGKADRYGLHIVRLDFSRRAAFTRVRLRLETLGVFRVRHRQQIAEFRGIEDVIGGNDDFSTAVAMADGY